MSPTVSTELQQIAEQAVQRPDWVFRSLAQRMDVEFLKEAYAQTRKDGAPGVDGVTARAYGDDLDANLTGLHERLRSGRYQAPPVKRSWVPKEDGTQRPIGMPAFEDKVVQRAVAMLMGAIYEKDFLSCSYGFRPGRSAHDALWVLRERMLRWNIRWVVDADIQGFFDSIDHERLRKVIRKRVNDGGIIRLIGKWLNAGVLEEGTLSYPAQGTPQGGVISPLLANIYLHEVLDGWFEHQVKPCLKGRAFLVRFADDFVIGCEVESDARRIMAVLPKRFSKYGLTIHPTKTVLVPFGKPTPMWKPENGTFNFLGFTHYWGQTRRGSWTIQRRTSRKRVKRTMRAIWVWCREHRHDPFQEQYHKLCIKLKGHIQYYGVRGNYAALASVVWRARRAWQYWLDRRSHKQAMPWPRFRTLSLLYPLPRPCIVHDV